MKSSEFRGNGLESEWIDDTPMTTKTNDELMAAFRELLPQPEKHYSVQADWKDWINLEHWLRTVLEAKDQQIAEAVEAERERTFEEIRAYTFEACPYEGTMVRAFINHYTTPNEAETYPQD